MSRLTGYKCDICNKFLGDSPPLCIEEFSTMLEDKASVSVSWRGPDLCNDCKKTMLLDLANSIITTYGVHNQ